MAGLSPTQLSLREMRRRGYRLVVVVEHYNHLTQRKDDLFGMFDIVALGRDETVGIQTTSYDNVSHRIKKLAEHDNIGAVREAGWTILVHGWHHPKNGAAYQLKREVDLS